MRLVLGSMLLLLSGCAEQQPPLVGTLERDRIALSADYPEPVVEILVHEGQEVDAGARLLRLNPSRLEARKAQAEGERDAARERLAELERGPRDEAIDRARAAVERAQADLVLRRRELKRLEPLQRQNLASEAELDRARSALESADASHREALAELAARLEGTTVEQLAQGRAQLRAAEARVAEVQEELSRLTLRAPAAGRVEVLPYELGERAPVGQALAIMLSGPVYAEVYVPQPLRAKTDIGREARVRVEGLKSPLKARLRYISSEAAFTPFYAVTEDERSRLVYRAELVVTDPPEDLPIGVPIEVHFLEQESGSEGD